MSDLKDRIRQRLTAIGKSATAASVEAGLGPDFIRDIYRGKKLSIGLSAASDLSKVLKTTATWLQNEDGESLEDEAAPVVDGIRYGGIVQAGIFRRVNIFNQDAEYAVVPIQPNPHYPYAAQFAFKVEGESMNLERIHPGMWVHAVEALAWSRLHGEPNDGELVVVEVFRNDNQERELTVKMMRIFRDRIELQPRSSESGHETYIIPHSQYEEFSDKYRVKAVVLSSTWLHRFKGL